MNMETLEKRKAHRRAFPQKATPPRFKSVETFRDWHPEDGYKYEWINGRIERTEGMKENEVLLIRNLTRAFIRTAAFQQGGELISEVDVMITPDQLRRPDFAYLTLDQVRRSVDGRMGIPSFVIEVISPNDRIKYLEEKLQEYFDAGIQVVWHIFPNTRQLWIYSDPLHHSVHSGSDVCSAAPALPDFAMTVEDMFRMP